MSLHAHNTSHDGPLACELKLPANHNKMDQYPRAKSYFKRNAWQLCTVYKCGAS